jgi:hypothetical protein
MNRQVPSRADFRPSQDVVFRSLDDEAVLVHLGTNSIYSLNPTGARFWELLAAGHATSEIKARLSREFQVEPDEVEKEVEALLSSLLSEGLVSIAPSE